MIFYRTEAPLLSNYMALLHLRFRQLAITLYFVVGGNTLNIMKGCRRFCTTMGVLLLISFASSQDQASGSFPSDKTYKIGLASREIVNDFNRGIIEGAQEVIENAGGTLAVTDAQGDPRKHNENIENLINSGIDGLIIQLGDAQQLAPVVAKAVAAGIPVVTTAVGAQTPGALTEVGGDEVKMAEIMSNALLESINFAGDVYVFWVPGAPLLETRKEVLEAIVADYPEITLHDVPTEHSPSRVFTQMQDLLTANSQQDSIAAVWGAYDLLVSGAVQAILQAGRSEIKVASIDGDQIGFQMLFQEGSPFIATVAQDVPGIGKLAGSAIVSAINGKGDEVPKNTYTNAWLATRNNGLEAAELRWGPSIWDAIQMDPKEIESRFPQDQVVTVVGPETP